MSEHCFLVMPECRASLSLSLMKSLTYIVTQEVTSQNILYAKYVQSLYSKVRNTR